MSLVTTCPACSTAFRVTPEQLSAHRGDVRCGQCQHIFNALRELEEIVPGATAHPAPGAVEYSPEAPLKQDLALPEAQVPISVETVLAEESLPMGGSVDFELDFPGDEQAEPVIEPESTANPVPITVMPEPPLPRSGPASPDASNATASPSFLQPKLERRASRRLLAPLALLLLAAALGQTAYSLRTEIAAHYPPIRPLLEQACRHLACVVDLPRQADLLSIEDSDLQDDAEHAGVLVLTSVLYNHAPYSQAYPLLELTLTDTFDKPVLRRTFTPQEYLPTGTDIEVGIAGGGEIRSRLPLSVAGEKPAGYRLYVRY